MNKIETAYARGYRVGVWVELKSYKKVRGRNEMDDLRKSLIGQKAIINGYLRNKEGAPMKDKSGCLLVSIQVNGQIVAGEMFGGHQLSWRLSSLKKI